MREKMMRKFTISAAAITTFAALVGTVPALADHNGGGPTRNASNQCFNYSTGSSKDGTFGYWGACPQTASAAAAASFKPRARRTATR
jgi:hypothetical protein